MPDSNHQKEPLTEAISGEKKVRKGNWPKKADRVGTVAGNLVLLYIINHLMEWHIPFMTADFSQVLPYMNWSIGAIIVANLLFLFFDKKIIRLCVMPVLNILSLVSVYILFRVFPFDFQPIGLGVLNQFGKILLGLAVAGVAIGIAVDWYKFIRDY